MTVLRSREVLPHTPTPKSLNPPNNNSIQIPSTPSQLHETHPRRACPDFPSHSPNPQPVCATDSTGSPSVSVSVPGVVRRRSSRLAAVDRVPDNRLEKGFSGKNSSGSTEMGMDNGGSEKIDDDPGSGMASNKRERKKIDGVFVFRDGNTESKDWLSLSLRSGKRVVKTAKQGHVDDSIRHCDGNGDELVDGSNANAGEENREVMQELKDEPPRVDEDKDIKNRRRFSRREKGKWTVDGQNSNMNVENLSDRKGKRNLDDMNADDVYADIDERRYAENGNGGLESIRVLLSLYDKVAAEASMRHEGFIDSEVAESVERTDNGPESENDEGRVSEPRSEDEREARYRQWLFGDRFRDTARTMASEYAHFYNEVAEENASAPAEGEKEIEDWPGPFSTAMKIARDRATKDLRFAESSLMNNKPAPVIWVPRETKCHKSKSPPPLQDLCLLILAKNVDAIVSLDTIPDSFRHRLSRLICDSRKMNSHFLDLLLRGTPTEVCVWDCSWLNEDEFLKQFQGRDTSKLVVLQLDQCGRCIVDYVLVSSLARSSNSLPALKSLSLSGACRLSDAGITALVSSAPALQCVNLSQCSFITSSAIDTLANSLGSTLRELHLNDCQNLSPLLMVSALKKLEYLEVLSLAGIPTVCDNFIVEFTLARGHNMKELILTDCVKLTDKSIKAISETCSALCAIDLVNLTKLSDYALCCLASGCPALQKLKLSRNSFSDEAVAAFVDMSGENLRELSLNHVRKVGRSTALSLACFCRNLVSLDLSWCRNLPDEALGMIVDSCPSLRVLKLFGCTQVTSKFLDGHSNPDVEIIGLKLLPLWQHVEALDPCRGPYSS